MSQRKQVPRGQMTWRSAPGTKEKMEPGRHQEGGEKVKTEILITGLLYWSELRKSAPRQSMSSCPQLAQGSLLCPYNKQTTKEQSFSLVLVRKLNGALGHHSYKLLTP
ncbi:uncharacterized protein LOC144581896 [Callithrix jacchus]